MIKSLIQTLHFSAQVDISQLEFPLLPLLCVLYFCSLGQNILTLWFAGKTMLGHCALPGAHICDVFSHPEVTALVPHSD